MEWINVGNGLQLPDIAAIVRARLEDPRPFTRQGLTNAQAGAAFIRQLTERRGTRSGVMRLSSSGQCPRRMAFQAQHYEPSGYTGGAGQPVTFAIGDAVELVLVMALWDCLDGTGILLDNAGPKQRTVSLRVPLGDEFEIGFRQGKRTAVIPGHPDGVMKVPVMAPGADPASIPVVLEIKSMSDFGFKKFREKGLAKDDSYMGQTQAYQMALTEELGEPVEWTYMLAAGKNVGAKDAEIHKDGSWAQLNPVVGQWIPRHNDVCEEIMGNWKQAVTCKAPLEIEVPHKPIGGGKYKGRLKFPCDWCPYWRYCWPSASERAVDMGAFGKKVCLFT